MKLKNSIFTSLSLHILFILYFVVNFPENSLQKLSLTKGGTYSLSFQSQQKSNSNGKNSSEMENHPKQSSLSEGTISEEIQKFKNQLKYPADALEQGLETDCEWEVEINEFGKVKFSKNIHPCKYKIFENEFQQSISHWKFDLPAGTILQIPVRFKIQKGENQ